MGVLALAILLGLAASTTQKSVISDDIAAQLATLLKSSDTDLLQDIHQALQKSLESPLKRHRKRHRNAKGVNHMNIRNVNVVIKNNNLRRKPSDLDQNQTEADIDNQQKIALKAMCDLTGRCGEDVVNRQELGQFIDGLQEELKHDQSSLDNLRCGCSAYPARIGDDQDQNGQGGLRCGCHKKRGRMDDDRGDEDDDDRRPEDYDVVLSKKYNNLIKTIAAGNDEKTNNFGVYTELNPDDKNEEELIEHAHPEDFFRFYQNWKARVLNKLMAYVVQQENDNNIDLSRLSKYQREKLMNIRESMSKRNSIDGVELRNRIQDLVFGEDSLSLVIPHNEMNDNIYVPQWVYSALKPDKQALRKQKLFPLTKQQKLKLAGLMKEKTPSITKGKPRQWRRSMSEDLQSYGVPFELEVQGLGQVNA